MQTRSVRITTLTLLLATPLAAAVFLWALDRRAARASSSVDRLTTYVERMRDALAEIGVAQTGYVAPGQLDEPWFERSTAQIAVVRSGIAEIRPLLRSAAAATVLDAVTASLDALEATDVRTRQNLSLGQDLMAADVVFSDGRNMLDGIVARLRDLQQAERAVAAGALASAAGARWGVLAILAFGWIAAGLFACVGRGFTPPLAMPEVPEVSEVPEARPGTSGTPGTFSVDLAAAAALCTDLARVTDTAALPPLVARAADLLDASGLTLWMNAGEQLFAVLGHGYPAGQMARFGSITRTADNAAAAAWRDGRLSVIAGTPKTSGALVVPMFGPGGCIGMLALEIRRGREQDPGIQAVAGMVAAQLATAVAAWPAASGAPAPKTSKSAKSAKTAKTA